MEINERINYNKANKKMRRVNRLSSNQQTLDKFQAQVSELLLRHRSLLDILSKIDQTSSSVNRSVIKAVTDCGCISIHASKQPFELISSIEHANENISNHVSGQLCDQCHEYVETQLGRNLFYLTALCSQLDINLQEVLNKETSRCSTLGFFNLT